MVQQAIDKTFKKYLIMPEDFTPSKKEKQKGSQLTKSKQSSVSQSSEPIVPQCKGLQDTAVVPVTTIGSLGELPDKQMIFSMDGSEIIAYDRSTGMVRQRAGCWEPMLLSKDELVNDIMCDADTHDVVMCTSNYIKVIHQDGAVDTVDRAALSACKFNGEIVTASRNGLYPSLTYTDAPIVKISNSVSLKNPAKIRSSKDHLFVLDRDTSLMFIFNKQFETQKVINFKKYSDFCVISESQIAVLNRQKLCIINVTAAPFTERDISLGVGGTYIYLTDIECFDMMEKNKMVVGLGTDAKTLYTIPVDK